MATPEFKHPGYPVPKDVVNTLIQPFNEEQMDGDVYHALQERVNMAGERFTNLWETSIENGLGNVLMSAEFSNQAEACTFFSQEGVSVDYWARYLGPSLDRLQQPIDVYRFSKFEGHPDRRVDSMTIATYRGKRKKYSQLIALIIESIGDEPDLPLQHFHFKGKNLFFLRQESQPSHLFPNHDGDENQFMMVQLGPSSQSSDMRLLTVVTGGINHHHLYQNMLGEMTRTYRASVNEECRLEIEEETTVNLPKAIDNMSQFETATTA